MALIFLIFSAAGTDAGETPLVKLSPEERNWLDANPDKLTLYFNIEFPPIEFIAPDGSFTGMGADVIAKVERRLGIRFIRQPSDDWNKHLADLASGACAVAPTIVRTTERERFAFFTEPYATVPVVIITGRADGKILTIDSLEGKRVAVVSGFATESYLRGLVRDRFEIVTMPDVPHGLWAVSFGQVDAFVENLAVAAYYIQQEGIPNLRVAGNTDYRFAFSIGISRNYPLLYSAVSKALNSFTEKENEALRKKWISLRSSPRLSPGTVLWIKFAVGFCASLLLGLIVISYFLKHRLNEKVRSLRSTQQHLQDQTDRLTLALHATRAGIWDYDLTADKIFLSDHLYAMLGYPRGPRHQSLDECLDNCHSEDRSDLKELVRDYLEQGGQGELEAEFRVRDANDVWCWVLIKGRVIGWDPGDKPIRLIGLIINIQAIKDVQEELVQSERKFRAIFDNAPYSIVINSLKDGSFLDANRTFLESRGLDRSRLEKANAADIALLTDEEQKRVVKTLLEKGSARNVEAMVNYPQGLTGHVIFSSELLEIQGQRVALSMIADVTDQKRAEEALKKSESRFRSLFKLAPSPLAEIGPQGEVIEVNDRFVELTGYTLEDAAALDEWWKLLFPDSEYRSRAVSAWQVMVRQARETGAAGLKEEYHLTRKDGSIRTVMADTVSIGGNLLVSCTDLTERKRAEAERQKLQDQLLQSQKLEAIGRLAGGVAHDFNNLLTGIIGNTEMLQSNLNQADPLFEELEEIRTIAERAARLTAQLLAFSRKQIIQPRIIRPNEVLQNSQKMLRRIVGEDIEFKFAPGADLWNIKADSAQIDQVLVNLVVNARDAMPQGGELLIETRNVTLEEEDCRIHAKASPGDYVVLAIADQGIGMDAETVQYIFEPFFSTKEDDRGTGLGLATVHGVVEQNGGFITVESEPGAGTSFTLYFPAVRESPESHSTRQAALGPIGDEKVLLVEDEDMVRRLAKRMLERFGYRVVEMSSGREALEYIERENPAIDLLLTDVIMPGMNGRELYESLLPIRPNLKVLFMSGYTEEVIAARGVLEEGTRFLQKPFTIEMLTQKVREVLDE